MSPIVRLALGVTLLAAPAATSILDLDFHSPFGLAEASSRTKLQARDTDSNGTTFLWLLDPEDSYKGTTFFDTFDFWTAADPTNGKVNYVSRENATAWNLTSFANNGTKVIMKGDDSTWLPSGAYRNSVRITSQKVYDTGSLFILDIDTAPWGCAVWPAWWTVGGNWPSQGEIDIIEGVHDNEHNQVTWHTADGCYYTPGTNYTGTIVNTANTTCYAYTNSNAGCALLEQSRASYGPYFDAQGGGVFAMKWDEVSISVWSFYRSAIPADIHAGNPDPSRWGQPVASLQPDSCDFNKYFHNHSIVFDITFCGDWAGNSYPTSCPGTCTDRLMNPTNFVSLKNATWVINYMDVYKKHVLSAPVSSKNGAALNAVATWLIHAVLVLVVAYMVG